MFQSYQLAPVNLRPPVRPSRSAHAKFLQTIEECVTAIRDEREVVDSNNEYGQELLNTMDAVLSHGLISDRCYWKYVKEFMPKSEQSLMEIEWSGGRNRRISFAWLKDCFNRGTIYFQLLAFQGARKITRQYYHANSVMRNYGIFEAIVAQIGKLESVQFGFDSEFRADGPLGAPAATAPVPLAIEAIERQTSKPLEVSNHFSVPDDSHLSSAFVDDRYLENIAPSQMASVISQRTNDVRENDYLLNDLVKQRWNRISGFYVNGQGGADSREDSEEEAPKEEERKEERLDDVLRKTMSQVCMEPTDVARSFDKMLSERKEKPSTSEVRQQILQQQIPGEITLISGEVLRFAMDVFVDVDEGEKLQRLFHVYDGVPSVENARLLLITDRNLYLLTQTIEAGEPGASSRDIQVAYHSHVVMPLPFIEYFEVTHGGIIVTAYAASGRQFTLGEMGTENDRIVAMVMADQLLGKTVIETIAQGVISLGEKPPSVYENKSPFNLILNRFISKQNLTNPDIRAMFIAFWAETPRSVKEDIVEPAYFFRRETSRGWFASASGEWEQSYFVLRDCKLYVFRSSNCHDGQKIIDLMSKDVLMEEAVVADHPNVVSFTLEDCTFDISFPSIDEKHRWIHSMQAASCQIPESTVSSAIVFVTDSHVVVGQLGSNAHVDGFIRVLATFKCELMRECLFYKMKKRTIVLIGVEDSFEWFMLRTDAETERFRKHFSAIIPCYDLPEFPENEKLVPIIEAQALKYPNIFGTRVFVTGNDALSDIDNDER